MDILVNGEPLALELAPGASVGEALARADELLEGSGSIIVGLELDGRALDAEGFPAVRDLPASSVARVDIAVESAAGVRSKALSTLLEILALAREAAAAEDSAGADWKSIAEGAGELAEAFAGLFSADELSFVQDIAALLAKAAEAAGGASAPDGVAAGPDAALRADIRLRAEGVQGLARERLSEIEDPAGEMRKAAMLYRSQAADLAELPVLLQTGKDERAMRIVLLFIETFNKVIRLIPELRRQGFDTDALRVEGSSLPDFYASFNEVLRSLSRAFEDKDAVQIGDLAEYEVAPRMAGFFAAIEEALLRK